jgi:AraC family transcriptional regulator, positive regulator of tynA and feaB
MPRRGATMLVLDSDRFAPGDRNAALDATFNSREVPQRVSYVVPTRVVRHRIELFELGPRVHLLHNSGTGIRVLRGPREVRSSAPEQVALGYQRSGSGLLEAAGQRHVQRAGDLCLIDTTRPYAYEQSPRSDHTVLLLDPALLQLPVDLTRSAAQSLPASPLYRLVRQHLDSLCDIPEELAPQARARLGRAAAELVAALITTAVSDDGGSAPMHDTLPDRIAMYIDARLHDPALSAQQIAAAHHVSLRQLYYLWAGAAGGVPLAEWILRRRLDRALGQLAGPDQSATIAAIARRNGFTNASHFARRFRQAFEMTPRDWRRMSADGR